MLTLMVKCLTTSFPFFSFYHLVSILLVLPPRFHYSFLTILTILPSSDWENHQSRVPTITNSLELNWNRRKWIRPTNLAKWLQVMFHLKMGWKSCKKCSVEKSILMSSTWFSLNQTEIVSHRFCQILIFQILIFSSFLSWLVTGAIVTVVEWTRHEHPFRNQAN